MKLLIDLNKYRSCMDKSCDTAVPEGIAGGNLNINGRKSIRELAVFAYSCRRCKDAPCIAVCPEDALKKDDNGMIIRSVNRCVACKSCVSICPFGTMMTDFYHYKTDPKLYYDLNDPAEREGFIKASPEGTVMLKEQEKDESRNIFELLPGILVKDIEWEK
ncbi:MAG: 4Fe-4S binding protein, partial [Bacteroidales bacterium]|nr:4Fe-4S binding protein [Bacteroidales bacterium]